MDKPTVLSNLRLRCYQGSVKESLVSDPTNQMSGPGPSKLYSGVNKCKNICVCVCCIQIFLKNILYNYPRINCPGYCHEETEKPQSTCPQSEFRVRSFP